ncbi:MAG: M28 family peptidase [Opitutaceae bacterium]|nr:M28 family peptidase [Opitutaceae bacterium]
MRSGLALLASFLAALAAPVVAAPLQGFRPDRTEGQLALERRFDAGLDRADYAAWIEDMSAEPNHVGSPHNRRNAERTLAQFQEWGWEARIETFHVLYPTPLELRLELVAPTAFTARLHEPPVPGDRTSGRTADALPPYNVYGADGDVTAELVYVNYGMPDDYRELERRGIDVRGRIVIVRYGGGWRGLKPKLAHERGAVGCLIYSDPRDDGYGAGDTYPAGGFRPADGVQRGSVLDMPVYPGDPLTPGRGATEHAARLPLAEAPTVLRIPVMPISYGDAQPLLAALGGPVAPADWRGGLPLTYHLGPGPAKARMVIRSDWSLKPIHNVIARLPGAGQPDQWVLRGNHRDAWVFGAWDPLSGHAAMMAEAKALGALVRAGWRPRRTIVYASWDAEEPGLVGSTEWAEEHADELRRKAVAYVNSDTNTRGFLRAGGSPSLQVLVAEAAGAVRDPQLPMSALERLRAKLLIDGERKGATDEQRAVARFAATEPTVPLVPLGSGTDFTAFLDHVGIPVLSLEYGGEDQVAGCYHSAYDSFDHYRRFGDPGSHYGVALSQTIGRVVLRLADADVPPFTYAIMADTVGGYITELRTLVDGMREKTDRANRLVASGAFASAADPAEAYVPPPLEGPVPFLDFAPLGSAAERLQASARACDAALARALEAGLPAGAAAQDELAELLRGAELALTDPAGLPGRPWYRHMIYAPGLQTGYGVKTVPGLREAIEERRWDDAERYARIVAERLSAYADRLDQVTRLLTGVPPTA